jgi:2-methylcitrate dehydratase PrpD
MIMGITSELAHFVASTEYSDLPARLVERIKIHTLDALASGFVGARLPWALIVLEMVDEQGGNREASVFAQEDRVSVSQAALLNGVMISGFEAEHSGHLSHGAATSTPAALAIGERAGVSGEELILALAVGTETGCRIGVAQTRAVEDVRGFHNPGVNGPFTAAAVSGRLLGLDSETQARAFGIAGSHSAGLVEYAWDGSMTKRLHLGRSSQLGLESAVLASKGFTGPVTVIEGRFGLLRAFSPSPKPELALERLGEEWLQETTMIKPYAVHGSSMSTVVAVHQLKQEHEIEPREIDSVLVRSSDPRVMEERFRDTSPTNLLGAQCSLPYTTAVSLVRGLEDPLQLDESVLHDDEIRRIASLVEFELMDEHDDRLHLDLKVTAAGQQLTVETGPYRGSPLNPSSFDDVEDKFHRFSQHIVAEERRNQIVEMVRNLEDLSSVSQLSQALRVG